VSVGDWLCRWVTSCVGGEVIAMIVQFLLLGALSGLGVVRSLHRGTVGVEKLRRD
jgi:putative effector of murein hydrolase LrgA (UPF0299 family)